ncbi:ceramide synthase 4 [Orycteropus afer afer]|uniref:Ceramide synthase 4 n=1 Tax=Orycteropus afer afer TaxID=1230840 RepID=A0A8B7AZT3_ORYAF|nr:ceramide synthase 4 [Orycteropus afer afer]
MLSSLNEWLWQDKFWLPPNNSWADLEDRDGVVYAHPRDLLATLPLALALVAARMAFERFVGLPLSRWLGVRNHVQRPVAPNPVLERHFLTQGRRPKEPQLALLATQCGLTLRQTQRWFRDRRKQDQPHLTKKFCEASWRFLFYLCSFVGGLSVLYHESWLWTPSMCWDSYPNQPLNPVPAMTHRLPQDFKEQVAHHFVTISLIIFSYSANLLRIGSLVLLLHDASDYLLEACKMFNYTYWRRLCDTLFVIFSCVFLYTRLVLFPTQILYTTYYESLIGRAPFFGYYFFNALLMVLQLLHVFWSSLILRMISNFMTKGQMEKDIRSDVEESDLSEEEAGQERPQLRNGSAPIGGPRSRVAGRLANGHTVAM